MTNPKTIMAGFSVGFIALMLVAVPVGAIAYNSIGTRHVKDRSLQGPDIKANSVGSTVIADRSLYGHDIKYDSLGSKVIAPNAVGNSELVDDIEVRSLGAEVISVGALFNTDYLNLGASEVLNIPDNGEASSLANYTLTKENAYAFLGLNCLDSDGCNVVLAKDYLDGDLMYLYNEGENTVNLSDTPGVSELAGNFAMGQWDNIQLIFRDNDVNSSWMEVSRSDN